MHVGISFPLYYSGIIDYQVCHSTSYNTRTPSTSFEYTLHELLLVYLVLHESRHRQVVEELREAVPHRRVPVLAEAFVIEPVHLGDLAGLVIAPQDRDAVLEPYLRARTHRNHPPPGQKTPNSDSDHDGQHT